MTAIGRSTKVPNDRKVIGGILGQISRRTFEKHGFLLTALVYNATLRRPSESFFLLAEEIDQSYDRAPSDEVYLARQLKKIHAHYVSRIKKTGPAKGGGGPRKSSSKAGK